MLVLILLIEDCFQFIVDLAMMFHFIYIFSLLMSDSVLCWVFCFFIMMHVVKYLWFEFENLQSHDVAIL